MNERTQPTARKDNLIVQEIEDEIVVYDLHSHQAFSLNVFASKVWRLCDGKRTLEDMALEIDSDVEAIHLALEKLSREKLLTKPHQAPRKTFEENSRRDLLKQIALSSAFAAPLVSSITAPTAAQAASCVPLGGSCSDDFQCCTDDCTVGVEVAECNIFGLCVCVNL